MSQIVFLVIAALGLLAALGTVLARNLVHAALYLIAFFFIVACQFVMLEAEFLAAIQVLVYIGAVAILLIFGIMLTRNIQGDDTTSVTKALAAPGLVVVLGLFFVLVFGINNHVGLKNRSGWPLQSSRPPVTEPATPGEPVSRRERAINDMGRTVGVELVTRYALAFEVTGIMLTAALVGAIALAHRDVVQEAPPVGDSSTKRATTPIKSLPLATSGAAASTVNSGKV